MRKLITILLILCSFTLFAQKEAYNWYFGANAAINFESGLPLPLINSAMSTNFGCSTISDSAGNLLFYGDGERVFNRFHQQMPNGFGLMGGNGGQNSIAVPFPGHKNKYYIFTVGYIAQHPPFIPDGLYYSIVDLELDEGRGDIDKFYKNIPLMASSKAICKITSVRHRNSHDFWVIVRNLSEPLNKFHAYLITENGINSTPEVSKCLNQLPSNSAGSRGPMKISPDGKVFLSSIYNISGNEIGFFDTESGRVNLQFAFNIALPNFEVHGVEFSADSKYVYFTNLSFESNPYNRVLQYDLSKLYDQSLFTNSRVDLGLGGNSTDIQAGPDGKLYLARYNKEYLGVINNPGLQGIACDYDSLGVYLGGRMSKFCLPQFIQTYLLRFEYEGECAGENFIFTPNFNPVPDSIHWDFGDPGSGANNTSNELNPAHIYSQSGIFTVTAFVRYPDGRTETATREVTVTALPEPYPVSDTVICKGSTVTLQAESGFDSYLWSNNQTTDFIMVSDTGSYWVEAVNAKGCTGRDSVHVGWHPLPHLTTDTIISPTTCGNSIGAITGVNIIGGTPPYNVFWLNSIGDTIGITNNLYNLGVDNYELWVTDDSGCNNLIASFPVQ
ncbi:MAG: hypothetical protein CVT94_07270, partial [Bacteroidetes bacterium HGW-Bacteroidetes-11]